jgi:glucose/arabinose dehydrogenase
MRRILIGALAVAVVSLLAIVVTRRAAFDWGDCPSDDELARALPTTAGPTVELTRVAAGDSPLTALATRAGDPTLYVAEKQGRVLAIRDGSARSAPVLDLRSEVSATENEQGMLGLAFSPDGGRMYVNYTDSEGDGRVVEYAFADPVDATTARELFHIEDESPDHNGGDLKFGPDGMLYITLGDGGPRKDPFDRGQSLDDLFGSILRVDPTPDGGRPYTIPPDNPFVDRAGARPEVWAYGLRNPWRISFDRATGDAWIGDVGEQCVEEVDIVPAGTSGLNFGWSGLEGTRDVGEDVANAVAPVFEYGRSGGCAVIGGSVYRGTKVPQLTGRYVFADGCPGEVRTLALEGRQVRTVSVLGRIDEPVSSLAEGGDGELYVLGYLGGVYRIDPAGD